MTPTTLEPSLLQAASLVGAFKRDEIIPVMGALVRMGIVARDFDASQLPEGTARGESADKLPGLAVAELRKLGIVTVTGDYRKSSKASAKGRPVRVLTIREEDVPKAKAWLRANNQTGSGETQGELFGGKEAA